MNDQQTIKGKNSPPEEPNDYILCWIIQKLQSYFDNRRAEKKKENPTDRAARHTTNATWAIAAFTVVTIGVGYFQWRALQSTDNATHIAIDAARNAVEMAAQTAKQQLRAYVLFDGGQVTLSDDGKRYKVIAKVRNGGQTPALNMTRFIAARVLPANLKNPRNHPDLALHETGDFSIDLLPNGTFDIAESQTDIVSEHMRKQIAGGEQQLYIIGLVKYRDIFGRCQYSGFLSYTRNDQLIVFQNPSTHGEGQDCNKDGKADYPEN